MDLTGFNWLDLLIILIFLFYALEGVGAGFMAGLFDLVSFVVSFAIGLKLYSVFGNLLLQYFSIAQGFANAFGFFAAAMLSEIILNAFSQKIFSYIPSVTTGKKASIDKALGLLPGVASAFIIVSFFLTLIVSLPLSPFIKRTVSQSKIGNLLLAQTQGLEKNLNSVFGQAASETLNFLTVEPQGNEIVNLKFTTTNFTVDDSAEQEMFNLVNKERVSRGIAPLVFDAALRTVARQHCEDMFKRGYFSHYTPEGLSPFDRMANGNIYFTYAGENLALSPNTTLAMQGLMQSEGHRENILSPDFHKIGIGAIDGGIYGIMFSQEFTD